MYWIYRPLTTQGGGRFSARPLVLLAPPAAAPVVVCDEVNEEDAVHQVDKVDEVHQVHQVDLAHQVNKVDEVHQVHPLDPVHQNTS